MKKLLFTFTVLSSFLTMNGQTYTTQGGGNGNWSNPATWQGGMVPPSTIPVGAVVNINRKVIYDLNQELDIRGSVNIFGDTLRFQNNGGPGTGKNIFVRSTGFFQCINGGIILPTFLTNGSNNNGNFITEGGRVVIINSNAEFAQNWEAKPGSRRFFQRGCMQVGENYSNNLATDTLSQACIRIGLHGSGNFENDGGIIRVRLSSVLLEGNGNFGNKSSSSQILTYLGANYAFSGIKVSAGNLENNGVWDAPIDKYCVNGGNIQGSNAGGIDFTSAENCAFFNGFVCDCSPSIIILPASMKFFTANRQQQTVVLKWTSASENNIQGYVIERNTGFAWVQAGFVPSSAPGGNSSSDLVYQFLDINNSKSQTQYRLRLLNMDGKSSYSDIRVVDGESSTKKVIVYPNPSPDGRIKILLDDAAGSYDISIFDLNGKKLRSAQVKNSNHYEFAGINPGFYTLRIIHTISGEQSIEKVIVSH